MARARSKPTSAPKRALVPALASFSDPYVTATGKVYYPEDSRVDYDANTPALSSRDYKATKKRVLKELPAPVDVLNGVACIFMYSVLGVSDRQIADALKISSADVHSMRNHPAYGQVFEWIVGEFVNVNSAVIQSRLAAMQNDALTGVHRIAKHGKQESNQLRANQDLLDRGGHSRREVGKNGGMMGDELRIIMLDGDAKVHINIGGRNGQTQE